MDRTLSGRVNQNDRGQITCVTRCRHVPINSIRRGLNLLHEADDDGTLRSVIEYGLPLHFLRPLCGQPSDRGRLRTEEKVETLTLAATAAAAALSWLRGGRDGGSDVDMAALRRSTSTA